MPREVLSISLVMAVALAVPLGSCKRGPNVKSLNTFDEDGISFSYPKNWKISRDSKLGSTGGARLVMVEGASDEVAIITALPQYGGGMSLPQYVDTMASGRTKEAKKMFKIGSVETVSSGESTRSPIFSTFGEKKLEGLGEEFSIAVLGHPVPHRANYFLIDGEGSRTFLVAQAPKERFAAAEPGFAVVFSSLRVVLSASRERAVGAPTEARARPER